MNSRLTRIGGEADLRRYAARGRKSLQPAQTKIIVGMGTCGLASGAREIFEAVQDEVQSHHLPYRVSSTACIGWCSQEPLVDVRLPGKPRITYGRMDPQKARDLVRGLADEDLKLAWAIGFLTGDQNPVSGRGTRYCNQGARLDGVPRYEEIDLFRHQVRLVLRNCGLIDPSSLDEYIARKGYAALRSALERFQPTQIIAEVDRSGLRGRGGAGFPTGKKWEAMRKQTKTPKYIVCNGDEGDPGAYMDRAVLEGDPHSVLEGMIIGAYAMGASEGIIYVREEYPLAVERMQHAIAQAEEAGLLGDNIFNSGFSFRIRIAKGAGAFVCGEETALIASVEGRVGEPRPRPPYPVERGLWGCPTCINNVETWANIPVILMRGGEWFSKIGTATSKGTKVFSLVGAVNNTALIEVPMGISLRQIVHEVGGGIPNGRKFKAVQTGGPSGGCIPESLLDLPVDYESLTKAGAIMGSGGMIVMDESNCMVDIAKYFLTFLADESCGKCFPCRKGLQRMLEIVTRISEGNGTEEDLTTLEDLSWLVRETSLCGLGQTAPNAVLATLRHFREEFESHVKHKRCPAVVCRGIVSSPCQYLCPLETDVPAYLALTAQGRYREAMEVIRRTNPFPAICGRVCMAHCETHCRAGESGKPIAVKEIKRFLSDWELAAGEPPPVQPFKKQHEERIAVVGAGPAGLTAAYFLAQWGYEVTVFEALPVAGGMLAVGIPEFRLPRRLLQLEIDAIARSGVTIKTNSPVKDIDALFAQGFHTVLIAVGAHKNRRLGIPGEKVEGMVDPIAFLKKVNLKEAAPLLGQNVAVVGVVGGGNTAIDSARTALRLGAKNVTILYRRSRAEMPAAESEVQAALDEGIKMEFLVAPTRVISEQGRLTAVEFVRMHLGEPDQSGRPRPIPIEGSEFTLPLDALIPALSQDPDLSFLKTESGIDTRQGTVGIDPETFMTARPGVFSCGDAVTGSGDVTTAMATAKTAATVIHKYLRSQPLTREYHVTKPSIIVPPMEGLGGEEASIPRPEMPMMPAGERRRTFDEVELGLKEEAAVREARRCLRCDWDPQRLQQFETEEAVPK